MKKKLLVVLTIFFLGVALAGVGLWFGFTQLAALKDKEAELDQKIAEQKTIATKTKALHNAFEKVKQNQGDLQSFFYVTNEEDWLRFVTDMQNMIAAAGIKAEVTVSDYTANDGKPFLVTVRIDDASWAGFYHYMKLLEAFPGRLAFDNFQVQGGGAPQDAKTDAKWIGSLQFQLLSVQKNNSPKP